MNRLAALAFAAMLAASSPAFAHAFLKSATPAVGGTVAGSPKQVELDMTEGVEPAFSTVDVRNASGARVDIGQPATAPGDDTRLIVQLKPLSPGRYTVAWHATATDTHKTEGSFTFTVSP